MKDQLPDASEPDGKTVVVIIRIQLGSRLLHSGYQAERADESMRFNQSSWWGEKTGSFSLYMQSKSPKQAQ